MITKLKIISIYTRARAHVHVYNSDIINIDIPNIFKSSLKNIYSISPRQILYPKSYSVD